MVVPRSVGTAILSTQGVLHRCVGGQKAGPHGERSTAPEATRPADPPGQYSPLWRPDRPALVQSRLLQPSGHALLGLRMCKHSPFLNGPFTTGDTLEQPHTSLQQLIAFDVYKVGTRKAVLRNQNRFATALQLREQLR